MADTSKATADIADLKTLISQLPIALYVCESPSGLIRLYNRRAVELWGHEPTLGEQRYCGALRLFRPDGSYLPHAETPMAEVVLFGGERNEDMVIERPDGSRIVVRVNITALRDPQGRLVGAITAFDDVSDRKRIEDDAARLAAIVVGADEPIISKSLDGQILSWNRAAEAMFGYSEAEVLGKSITIIVPPERLAEEEMILLRIRRGEAISHFETERVAKDGQRIQVVLTMSPISDRHGRVIGASTMARDIREQKRLHSEREELLLRERVARAQAEAANRTKDEFLAMLAHELRNPVGVIVNALAVLEASRLDAAEQTPPAARARTLIRHQTQHLARLLDDLLDVARITAGRIELERKPVDLRVIIQTVLETERHHIERKQLRVARSLGEGTVRVIGDPLRLQQVIGNLLSNAWKYTPPNGSISIALAREAEHAVVRVLDSGAGIPPERLDEVFDLFTQVNPSLARTEGGLGIGLTLVKRLVDLHNGEVRAYSDGLGKGSEFVVRLPLAREAVQSDAEGQSAPSLGLRRILVIEDNTDAREMLAIALRLAGHEVLEAATGADGIEIVRRHRPEIVLVDIGLPDIDGYEVARRLRQTADGRFRLIALTGYGQARDRALSRAAGFDAHLLKPLDPSTLEAAIEQLG
jgi:two-component system, chemotaxis family, CheB/CheR fusion protein